MYVLVHKPETRSLLIQCAESFGFAKTSILVLVLAKFLEVTVLVRRLVYRSSLFCTCSIGTITRSGTPNDPLVDRRVFLTPSRGWEQDPVGPEER